MPSPKSPLTVMVESLAQSSPLKGRARIFLGADCLSNVAASGRIVIIPTTGLYVSPSNNATGLVDVKHNFAARVWGADFDEAWDFHNRLIQAVNEYGEAAGNLSARDVGPWWDAITLSWNIDPDANKQGKEVEVIFVQRLEVLALPTDEGRVGANWPAGEVDSVTVEPA